MGNLHTKGYYGTDKVRIGDFSGDLEFGVAEYSTTVGILGSGFPHSVILEIDYKNLSSHKSFTVGGQGRNPQQLISVSVWPQQCF